MILLGLPPLFWGLGVIFCGPNHPPHASLSREALLAYAGVVVDGARFLRPLLGRSTGPFGLGGVAAGAAVPSFRPNHPPRASLSREVFLAYAGFVVDGVVLSSPFTGAESWAF
jgi:hypothetical protein